MPYSEPSDGIPWPPDSVSEIGMSERCIELVKRIFSNCSIEHRGHETACYEWQGASSGYGRGGGYGRVKVDGHVSACHRVIWSCFNGYISPKRDIDHKCNNRICCNPEHIQSVTPKMNQKLKFKRAKEAEEME